MITCDQIEMVSMLFTCMVWWFAYKLGVKIDFSRWLIIVNNLVFDQMMKICLYYTNTLNRIFISATSIKQQSIYQM